MGKDKNIATTTVFWGLLLFAVGGCKGGPSGVGKGTDTFLEQPTPVVLTLPAKDEAEGTALRARIAEASAVTPADLAALHPVDQGMLSYDPLSAARLGLIRASSLNPSEGELAVLGKQGFVISTKKHFPTFAYGYDEIFVNDLPVFVSADSLLYTVHRSYDEILKAFEKWVLIPELQALLEGMRVNLAESTADVQTRADADLYLAVPLSLLTDTMATPVAGGSSGEIKEFIQLAQNPTGERGVTLFGVRRDIDSSQFKPRGHYGDSMDLTAYFRAMMWLGRFDFRLIETRADGTKALYRRQVEAMLLLQQLLGTEGLARWGRIEAVLQAFVGKADSMTPAEVPPLLGALGISTPGELTKIDDQTLAQTIINGGFGTQKVASQLMAGGIGNDLSMNRSFLLFGQRYVLDSHVFSNLVFNRVGHGSVPRLMPNPLDIAYAVFGNNQALPLLEGEFVNFKYAPDLEALRVLVDARGDGEWNGTLYDGWLNTLRALSPIVGSSPATLPEIARTEGWGRRVLNTQLASWSELRHDTILYTKQSYSSGGVCEFPDAFVDPYPEFFRRLQKFAEQGSGLSALVPQSANFFALQLRAYFTKLATAAGRLAEMAQQELDGTPFIPAQLKFINELVRIGNKCGPLATGWYADLFFAGDSLKRDPTIADVHTQPSSLAGAMVGRVLHVGTADPRLMIMTTNTCAGPAAYVGLVSSYHERITEKFQRLSDEEWAPIANQAPDVPWMLPVLGL